MQIREDVEGRPKFRVRTLNEEPTQTVQSQRDQSEIREILRRHGVTGVADQLAQSALSFQDVSSFEDFADVMRQRRDVEQKFMRLPSKVREVFNHDVDVYLDSAFDGPSEAQIAALTDLGVLGTPPSPRGVPASPAASEAAPATPPGPPAE